MRAVSHQRAQLMAPVWQASARTARVCSPARQIRACAGPCRPVAYAVAAAVANHVSPNMTPVSRKSAIAQWSSSVVVEREKKAYREAESEGK